MTVQDIPPALLDVLRGIGLQDPDLEVPLHARLVATLHRLGPGATSGQRLVALRFDFAWELEEAGRVFAKAKTDYEHFVAKTKAALMLGDGFSGTKAEAIATGDDKAYELKLTYLLAEQRERAMRNFLGTIQSAQDNHRTDRADARAADTEHTRSGT